MAAAQTDAVADGPQAAVPGDLDLPPPLEPVPSEEDSDSSGGSDDEDSEADEAVQASADQANKGASLKESSTTTSKAEPAAQVAADAAADAQTTGDQGRCSAKVEGAGSVPRLSFQKNFGQERTAALKFNVRQLAALDPVSRLESAVLTPRQVLPRPWPVSAVQSARLVLRSQTTLTDCQRSDGGARLRCWRLFADTSAVPWLSAQFSFHKLHCTQE